MRAKTNGENDHAEHHNASLFSILAAGSRFDGELRERERRCRLARYKRTPANKTQAGTGRKEKATSERTLSAGCDHNGF
jgi:hypothetical protein